MVSIKQLVLAFSTLALATRVTGLTQEEADARCVKKLGAGYVAKKNAEGAASFLLHPSEDICFENEYTDPKTGVLGCCPDNSPFSYDPASKEGKCCPEGSKFSWDATAQKGDCCTSVDGQDCEYKCSCQVKKKEDVPPKCPEGSGKTWTTGGKTYKLTCSKMVGGASISQEPQPDLATCATKCATVPGCKSVDWYQQKCWYKTDSGEPPYDNPSIDNWHEVSAPSPAPIPAPAPVPVPAPVPTPWSCPADNNKIVPVGNEKFKIYCDYTTSQADVLRASPSVNPEECAKRCANTAKCNSATWYGGNCWLASPVFDAQSTTLSSPGQALKGSFAMIRQTSAAPDPITLGPKCPADHGKFFLTGDRKFKVFCNYTTGQYDISGAKPSATPDLCANSCALVANCYSATWYGGNCWLASPVLTTPSTPLANSIAMLRV